VSEKFAEVVEKYIRENPNWLLKPKKSERETVPRWVETKSAIKPDNFRSLMYMRYMKSLVDPGEAVGLMASQGFVIFLSSSFLAATKWRS
jgi:DNA-directed RNA polymerase I subunit RPA1